MGHQPACEPDVSAPRLFFSVLLDSGATYPTLLASDLRALGVRRSQYSASSAVAVSTLNAVQPMRVYEMEVGLFAGPSRAASLVDGGGGPDGPATWPGEVRSLACVTPVLCLPEGGAPAGAADGAAGAGAVGQARLSGLVPWQVAYTASAPTTRRLWVGAERGDVLGAHRMPGQLRYSLHRGGLETGRPRGLWPHLEAELAGDDQGGPGPTAPWTGARRRRLQERWARAPTAARVVFEHTTPGGMLIRDADVAGDPGASIISLHEDDKELQTWRVEPREQARQRWFPRPDRE